MLNERNQQKVEGKMLNICRNIRFEIALIIPINYL
jgi:hypothetical protein